MTFSIVEVFSAFMVLFAVIDIIGAIPIILSLKAKGTIIEPAKATLVAFAIMLLFLFIGEPLLNLFGVDISSFAIAGSFVLFFLALEMVLGHEFFKSEIEGGGASIVPIAFPLIAGAGSITSLISLKAEYDTLNIGIALFVNMILVYLVLRATKFFERTLGKNGVHILKKFFGIILLSISIKLFISNTGIKI